MKKKAFLYMVLAGVLLFAVFSCLKVKTAVTDVFTNPSAREVYAREFKDRKPVYNRWELAFEQAIQDSLEINLPYGEKGTFLPNLNNVYSYTVNLEEGKTFTAEVLKDSMNQRVFMDLFQQKDSTFQHLESVDIKEDILLFHPKTSGTYKLVIQPEIEANSDFFIAINEKPSYFFPVAGHGNKNIQSFWGAVRGGGTRSHEGVDIFAKRGTPVVASVDGRVSRTGNTGLGGKQVWLRAGTFGGNSLYYAHLDSIAVTSGERVRVGDTLGFVGNTGNAKTTAPHLHFGIYKGYSGAINPLPFIFATEEITDADFDRSFNTNLLQVKSNTANLRKGPTTSSEKIGTINRNDTILLLGENKDWLHVKTTANQKAFLHQSLVQELN